MNVIVFGAIGMAGSGVLMECLEDQGVARVVAVVRPLLEALFPDSMLTSPTLGQAMIAAARRPPPKKVLEARDINALLR